MPVLKIIIAVMLTVGAFLGGFTGGMIAAPQHSDAKEITEYPYISEEEQQRLDEEKRRQEEEEQAKRKAEERKAYLEWVKSQDKKLVALTFDDGPARGVTERLLDILQEKDAKATFFVVGRMAQAAPEIIKREQREGHEVGSHTYNHAMLTNLNAGALDAEMAHMASIFVELGIEAPKLLRPPYGAINGLVRQNIGVPLVLWTVDTEDWRHRDAEWVRAEIMRSTFDGAIVLMHDLYNTTVDGVAMAIDELKAQGYELVTVSELAELRKVELETGIGYGSFRR